MTIPMSKIMQRAVIAMSSSVAIVAAGAAGAMPAQGAGGMITPEKVMEFIITTLTAEAEAAKQAGRFEHPDPDFASRLADERPDLVPQTERILIALTSPQSRDPFVDAYIRWQLTSFDPALPELSERGFLLLLNGAPAMVENPAAEPQLVAALRQAEASGRLSDDVRGQIDMAFARMKDQSLLAEEMNRPGREWRDWLAEKLGDEGMMPRLWKVERLTAMIRAGWPVSNIKADITRNFRASVDDPSFTAAQRQIVIAELRRFIGLERQYINNITFYAAGTIRVQVSRSSITAANVDNWHRALRGLR